MYIRLSLLMLVSITALFLYGCESHPPFPRANARAYITGNYLCEKYPGQKALLITTRWSLEHQRTERIAEGLEDALGAGNVVVDSVRIRAKGTTQVDHEDLLHAKDFDELIAKHPDCSLIVSMVGLPFDKEKMKAWNDPKKHIVMLNANIYKHRKAIESGKIVAAVAIKSSGKDELLNTYGDLESPEEIFASRYVLVTPENIKKLIKEYPLFFRH